MPPVNIRAGCFEVVQGDKHPLPKIHVSKAPQNLRILRGPQLRERGIEFQSSKRLFLQIEGQSLDIDHVGISDVVSRGIATERPAA